MSSLEGVNGTTCDVQQYQLPLTSPNRFVSCLTHGQTVGLAVSTRFLSFKVVPNLAYV